MYRRTFLAAAAGTILTPIVAATQQPRAPHRVGWLDYSSAAENIGTFVQAMGARGWLEGQTFKIEYRGGGGRIDELSLGAAQLVSLPVDVIVVPGTSEALAAKRATESIPIVMAGVDESVGGGLVGSLARPVANVTGVMSPRSELSGKLLSLLRELMPQTTRVAVLWDETDPDHRVILSYLQGAARSLSMSLDAVQVRRYTEVEPAFAAIEKRANKVLIVPVSSMLVPRWIADLSLKHRLTLASTSPGYAYEGGVMAYTDDWNVVFDRAATYVDKILKGARPADLPAELPTKFRLIVNARSAQTLGIAVPPSIIVQADYVIE